MMLDPLGARVNAFALRFFLSFSCDSAGWIDLGEFVDNGSTVHSDRLGWKIGCRRSASFDFSSIVKSFP